MAARGEGAHAADLVPPPDGAGRERLEQDPAELTALHLGAATRAVVGLFEQDVPVPVEDPHRLAARQDEAAELLGEARRREGRLAGVVVDVEHPALRPRGRGRFRLVDRDRDVVDVQDAGEREAAESGADDRDGGMHGGSSNLECCSRSSIGTMFQACQDDGVAPRTRRPERRTEALSRARIVAAAVELLDAVGEGGLTFRALTERLATGAGAIYWHVANKNELLGSATEAVVAAALADRPAGSPGPPRDGIRADALRRYRAVDAHPWLATQLSTQLSRSPSGSVTPRIFESVGRPVRALGVPETAWFTATSALVHYVLGAAGQNAANSASGHVRGPGTDRARFLDTVATAWEALDPDDFPFIRAVADQVRHHDDRAEFLAGVDLVLAGIVAVHPSSGGRSGYPLP